MAHGACRSMTPARRAAMMNRRRRISSLLTLLVLAAGTVHGARDLSFESAHDVNEGVLHFLERKPERAIHHHQNQIRIDAGSLESGWVELSQCHDNLDAVPRAQITFREGYVRDLRVLSASRIERAWVEDASVQLINVAPGARLCLSAQTRALRQAGNGYYTLSNGPFMRKFLDGYYPMQVTLDILYPPGLRLLDIEPPAQPGLQIDTQAGVIRIDALFEGELKTLIQFEQR